MYSRKNSLGDNGILILLCFLLSSGIMLQEPITLLVNGQNATNVYNMPPDIDCLHIISDTNITTEPIHGTNGTANEFSTDYVNESEFNFVELKWEHTPGDPIQRRDDYSGEDQEPVSWDYAYFSTTFEWAYEVLPVSCLSVLELEIECTGDFTQGSIGPSLYQVIVLLIDSNGKMARLQSEDSLRSAPYGYYSNDLSSWVIQYAWQDMIEDASGNQDAPTDIAEIRIVLAPTYLFFLEPNPPSESYDGSVTVRCKYMDIQVLADIPPAATPEEPIAVGSVGRNTSLNYVEMALGPNGSIFTLGRTWLIPDWGVIVKWDEDANPLWVAEWRDDAPEGIAVTDEYIYSVGQQNNNLSLGVWSQDGVLLEEHFYYMGPSSFGVEVSVSSEERIYILGYSYDQGAYTPFVLVLDSDYSLIHMRQFATMNYRVDYALEVSESGLCYVKIGNTLSYFQVNSGPTSSIEYNTESYLVTSAGELWLSSVLLDNSNPLMSTRRNLVVDKIKADSSDDVSPLIIQFPYSSTFFDSSWLSSIAIDSREQSVYVLTNKGVNFQQYIVVKLTSSGNVQWFKSLENKMTSVYPDDWKIWHELKVLDNDMICVSGTDLVGSSMNLTLAIFDINRFSLFDDINWVLVGVIAGAVIIADIVIITYLRKRNGPKKKHGPDVGDLFDEVFNKN